MAVKQDRRGTKLTKAEVAAIGKLAQHGLEEIGIGKTTRTEEARHDRQTNFSRAGEGDGGVHGRASVVVRQ